MSNVFASRSLNVIDDLSINERRYFFKKVKELKDAIIKGDEKVMDAFRINDPDFGIYEVFLEDSTRTKESFRNAAAFHHAKVSELISSTRARAMQTHSICFRAIIIQSSSFGARLKD